MDIGECRVRLGEETVERMKEWLNEEVEERVNDAVEKRVQEEVEKKMTERQKEWERRIKKEIKKKVEEEVERWKDREMSEEDRDEASGELGRKEREQSVEENDKEIRERNIIIRELTEKWGVGADGKKVQEKLRQELGLEVKVVWAEVIGVKGQWTTVQAKLRDKKEREEVFRAR